MFMYKHTEIQKCMQISYGTNYFTFISFVGCDEVSTAKTWLVNSSQNFIAAMSSVCEEPDKLPASDKPHRSSKGHNNIFNSAKADPRKDEYHRKLKKVTIKEKVADKNVNANTSESSSDSSSESVETSQSDYGDETATDASLPADNSPAASEAERGRRTTIGRVKSESKSEKIDYSKFTDILSDSVADLSSNYDYPKKIVKDYKLNLAGELKAKLDETRVQYEVLNYKLYKSKTKCSDLENENKRLRKQLEMHNEYEVKTSKVLLKHTTDLNDIRAKYREAQSAIEQLKMGMKPMISWRPQRRKSKGAKSNKSAYTKQESSDEEFDEQIQQINNNRNKGQPKRSPRRPTINSDKKQYSVSHHLNSNRKETIRDPAVILHAPNIGRRTHHSSPRRSKSLSPSRHTRKSRRDHSTKVYRSPLTSQSYSNGNFNGKTVILTNVSRSQPALLTKKQSSPKSARYLQMENTSQKFNVRKHSDARGRSQSLRRKQSPAKIKSSNRHKKISPVAKWIQSLPRRQSSSPVKSSAKNVFRSLRYPHGSMIRKSKSAAERIRQQSKGKQRGHLIKEKRGNKSNNNVPSMNENNHAIQMLNNMLDGVHFDSTKKLFYPGSVAENKVPLRAALDVVSEEVTLTGESNEMVGEIPLRAKISRDSSNKHYLSAVRAQLDELNSRKKLNQNEKYIKDQYKKLLLSNFRQRGSFLAHKTKPTLQTSKSTALNQNNNALDSGDDEVQTDELIDQSATTTHSAKLEQTPADNVTDSTKSNENLQDANANNNVEMSNDQPQVTNTNTNAADFGIHPEVSRLQHLLRQKEIQQTEFLEAFTDALLSKEAAVSLAEERLDTIHMLDTEMSRMRDEYEDIIRIKNDELDIQNNVVASYKDERFSLSKAFEKAAKCMMEKLESKNAALRKMNMAHHDEISELRRIVMQQEAELKNLTETLQRVKIFHEKEVAIFNQKVRELHDLTTSKEMEIHNYQQISAEVVHMAEVMNLDLHTKDEIIQQLRGDLANFQVGLNEVEGDKVLVKQNKMDKKVVSLGFPRIVDGNVVIWYKSRTHGDNFLILRIFGGKLFVVEKKDILPELNRILPNLLNSPTFTHAALKLDKATQWPAKEKACAAPSAMEMQIHLVGNRAHLAMEGRHLCSQKPILFVDEETEEPSLHKELTPRPYHTAPSKLEKAVLLSGVENKPSKKYLTSDEEGGLISTSQMHPTGSSSNGSSSSGEAETGSERGSEDGSDSSGSGSSDSGSDSSDSDSNDSDSSGSDRSSSESTGENQSSNARTNYTQNANTAQGTGAGEAEIDMDEFTTELLGAMKADREQVVDREKVNVAKDFQDGQNLQEVHSLPYNLDRYNFSQLDDSPTMEDTMATCASPRRRLRKIETEINKLGRKHVKTSNNPVHTPISGTRARGTNKRESAAIKQVEDYDWSLPEMDIPTKLFPSREAAPKLSDHNALASEAVKCAVHHGKPKACPVILKDDVELTGWKANKIGEDYRFTRLSGDEDLKQFILEHTLGLEDDPPYQAMPEVLYNEDTGRFQIPSPTPITPATTSSKASDAAFSKEKKKRNKEKHSTNQKKHKK